jgi:hypothetical protein
VGEPSARSADLVDRSHREVDRHNRGMLAFGGELNEFTKRIMMVVLALSVMLLASTFISGLGLP